MADPTDTAPIDTNVVIPRSVREASAAADAAHAAVYKAPEPAPTGQTQPATDPQLAAQPTAQQNDQPASVPQPAPQEPTSAPAAVDLQAHQQQHVPSDGDDNSDSWKHKFLSMQGRWQASQRQVGALTELNSQLAAELQQSQAIIERAGMTRAPMQQAPQDHKKLITDQDRETYGDELIDVVHRAAQEAVAPELSALRSENAELKKRVITTAQKDIYAALTKALPSWRQVNASPEFKQWLRLPNVYTGQVRQEMLNAAFQAANTAQVVAIFRDFANEVVATGGTLPQAQIQQALPPASQPAAQEPPRSAALNLEALAAPGKARPAGGDAAQPAEKPTYTRAQIAGFYADVRKGFYAGREAEKNTREQDIIRAQAEGRVRG